MVIGQVCMCVHVSLFENDEDTFHRTFGIKNVYISVTCNSQLQVFSVYTLGCLILYTG